MRNLVKEAVILAGGKGTRLKSMVCDVPKPMAPMDDTSLPFLHYVLENLSVQGFEHVVLSVGYKASVISDYFGNTYAGMSITYSEEREPLWTGGAIKLALTHCLCDDLFVLNGDTFFAIDYDSMFQSHQARQSMLTIAVKEMQDCNRYGTIGFDENNIIERFCEKSYKQHGYINGGIYCINRSLINNILPNGRFSFETDFLEHQFKEFPIYVYEDDGYFIDIGIPEDYIRAKNYFKDGMHET